MHSVVAQVFRVDARATLPADAVRPSLRGETGCSSFAAYRARTDSRLRLAAAGCVLETSVQRIVSGVYWNQRLGSTGQRKAHPPKGTSTFDLSEGEACFCRRWRSGSSTGSLPNSLRTPRIPDGT